MKNAGKILFVLGVVLGLLGIWSVWRDYTYRKASVVVKAEVLSAEIKDIRTKYTNYYLKPTHHITHHLAFERMVTDGGLSDENQQVVFQELASLFSNKQKDETEALKWYQKFIEYFEQQNNEAAIGQINRAIGNVLCNEYNFDTGIPYLIKSLENFTKARDYNSLSKSYNNLSLAYHDFGDYEKGIVYANLVVKTFQEHTVAINKNLMWYAYNNLGINYDDSKQYAKAIESHLNALPFALNASDCIY